MKCALAVARADHVVSSPARGTWIEIAKTCGNYGRNASSPARGTWIEIQNNCIPDELIDVVPRTGDVD